MTRIRDLHRRRSKDADYKNAYDALGAEFDLARALIEARTAAGLSQSQLARRMKTSQSYIARVEGARYGRQQMRSNVSQGPPGRGSGSYSNRSRGAEYWLGSLGLAPIGERIDDAAESTAVQTPRD